LVGVEQWAELRREHFVRGVSIKELTRRTGLSRNTIRAALRSPAPPRYERASTGSKLDPFKSEIHRLLSEDAAMPGQRIRELIAPLGFDGGKTIVDDYLRDVRPLFATPRTYQRTVYRPGEICQFDLWQPRAEVSVGHGKQYFGRGPTDCRTYLEPDLVIVVLAGGYTAAERTLFEAGKWHEVRQTRMSWQDSMEVRFIDTIERLTQRTVKAFLSANRQDTELTIELFVLERDAPAA